MFNTASRSISTYTPELDGVFTLPDLQVVLDEPTEITFFRTVRRLVEEGELIKVMRGLYAAPDAALEVISGRIDPTSYISTDTVLARHGIIGSVPVKRVQTVKVGRPRTYTCSLGIIEHLSLAPHLFFGTFMQDGRLVATPEKAFLDVWYYQFKGRRFPFDPLTDVNIELLDQKLLKEYLTNYDARFRSYFQRFWEQI